MLNDELLYSMSCGYWLYIRFYVRGEKMYNIFSQYLAIISYRVGNKKMILRMRSHGREGTLNT